MEDAAPFIPKTKGKITLENGLIKSQMKIIFIFKGYLQKDAKRHASKKWKWKSVCKRQRRQWKMKGASLNTKTKNEA